MRLSAVYNQLERGELLSGDKNFSAMVAIELLASIDDVKPQDLDYSAPRFAMAFPYERSELKGMWQGKAHYNSWRDSILSAQMIAAPGDTEGNAWQSLLRLDKLLGKSISSTLYDLRQFLTSEVPPQVITDSLLRTSYLSLGPTERLRFRGSVNRLRQLYQHEMAMKSQLLPSVMPQAIPGDRNHFAWAPMAPDLIEVRNSISERATRNEFDYLHRFAIVSGLLNGANDTLEGFRKAISALPDTVDVEIPAIKDKTLRSCKNGVKREIGGRDYCLSEIEQAWIDLRRVARSSGCNVSHLFALKIPATAANKKPDDLEKAWVEALIGQMQAERNGASTGHCYEACKQFDALRGEIPAAYLPSVPLDVRKPPKVSKVKVKETSRLKDPVTSAWDQLWATLSEKTKLTVDYPHLWYIRKAALESQLVPHDITQGWLENLRDTCPADRTHQVIQGTINLRAIPGFEHLSELRGRKQRHGGLPKKLSAELNALLAKMGAAQTTSRSYILSAGILIERHKLGADVTLDDLRTIDPRNVDWGCEGPTVKDYQVHLERLQRYLDLPWSSEWNALNALVVKAGISFKNNPIPKLLRWGPSSSPKNVTLEWAQILDRELRSTLRNPPHGRADLAQTMARDVAAFDALRDIASIADSGMLPAPIGQVRG